MNLRPGSSVPPAECSASGDLFGFPPWLGGSLCSRYPLETRGAGPAQLLPLSRAPARGGGHRWEARAVGRATLPTSPSP